MEVHASKRQVFYHRLSSDPIIEITKKFIIYSQECQLMTPLQLTTAKRMEDAHLTRMHCDRRFGVVSKSKMTLVEGQV